MRRPPWNDVYATGELPWDTGEPDLLLVDLVRSGRLPRGRALEVGCGTGTNALWLAEQGYDVLGVDLAPLAVEQARAKLGGRDLRCRFLATDFLATPLAEPPFDLAFDRGCFHVFDAPEDRARFAARIAAALAPGGEWLSLIGSTEGPPRDVGPPRRTAREVLAAVEPELELLDLRSAEFATRHPQPAKAWLLVARKRTVPAQASTKR